MPLEEAPVDECVSTPDIQSIVSSSPSDLSSSSNEARVAHPTPMFRAMAMPPPEPEQPPGQEELERRLPGYRRIVLPREMTLIEMLKQCSGVEEDEDVLQLREAKLRVIAERVGLRRLYALTPLLKRLTLDGSAMTSLRDLGTGLRYLRVLSIRRCGLTTLDGVLGLSTIRELYASGNRIRDIDALAALHKLHTLDLSQNPITETCRLWTLSLCGSLNRLTLRDTPYAAAADYRARVTQAVPGLLFLDDVSLNEVIEESGDQSQGFSSESEDEGEFPPSAANPFEDDTTAGNDDMELGPGPSHQSRKIERRAESTDLTLATKRPATSAGTENRPKTILPPRPHTAYSGAPSQKKTPFTLMHSLLDAESSECGSALTSGDAVCGNIARALRRSGSCASRVLPANELSSIDVLSHAARLASREIPRAPYLCEWEKFKERTGIDIDLDFLHAPKGEEPSEVLRRLEEIEKETQERLRTEMKQKSEDLSEPTTSGQSYKSKEEEISVEVNTRLAVNNWLENSDDTVHDWLKDFEIDYAQNKHIN